MVRTFDGASLFVRYLASALIITALSGCNSGGETADNATSSTQNAAIISGTPSTAVQAGQPYSFTPTSHSTNGDNLNFSIQNKPAWASFSTSTGAIQGTPAVANVGMYSNVVISASDGVSVASLPAFSVTVTQPSASSTSVGANTLAGPAVQRPSYNTGNGFFVLNGKLYDPTGHEFNIRGVNRLHWDSSSADGIAKSGANAVRWTIDFTRDASTNVSLIQAQSIQDSEVPIVGNWTATCKTDAASLQSAVATWVAQASQWTTLNRSLIVNIANEWGPSGSTVWRDSYISAIASLRNAGYTGPILADSGGCGQDDTDLMQYSQAVFNSDPERNVMFALHLYGGTNDLTASIKSIQKGNPTVVTLNSTAATHPFATLFNGSNNSYSGITAYQLSGVQGMIQANGEQPAPQNVGGVPGAWTVTLSVDSTNWSDYTGGGTLVDYYGNYALKSAHLAALSQSTGAVYIIGEFGPGNNIGPSPTLVTPAEIITAAEANGVGWLAWAWDDNDLVNCQSDNNWFSMTYNCGNYTQASDLTDYGQDVVLNPIYGITVLAKAASGF